MYGLVNKGVERLVLENFGEAKWLEIKEKAGVEVEEFVAMEPYDDAITYSLVGAASEVLEMSAEDILFTFGKYWVHEIGEKYYAGLMDAAGTTFSEFLKNLDHLHSRVRISFPRLEPPSFQVQEESDNLLKLRYYSNRPGLEPMVIGLLHGLGERFDIKIDVELTRAKEEGGHAEFQIRLLSEDDLPIG